MYAKCMPGFFSDSNVRFQIRRYDLPVMSRGRSIFSLRRINVRSFIHRLPVLERTVKKEYIKTRIIKFHDSMTTRDLKEGFKN